MKGVTDVEFILSVVLFLTVITFVTFSIVSKIPLLRSESANEDLRDTAYSISELLMNDNGEPADWNPSNVKRIGLSANLSHMLDVTKITNLNTLCSTSTGYDKVKKLLLTNFTLVRISLVDSRGVELLSCRPQVQGNLTPQFGITRFATLNSPTNKEIVRLTVDTFR